MNYPEFNGKIVFPPDSRVEALVGQMQSNFPYHIYVVDGWLCDYFTNLDEVPLGNYVLENASQTLKHPEWHIRNLDTDVEYVVFTPQLRDAFLGPRNRSRRLTE